MDRIKIKSKARKIIEGKLWDLWKPMLLIFGIEIIFGILLASAGIETNTPEEGFLNILFNFAMAPVSIGVYVYLLNFIRKKEYNMSNLFSQFKNFLPIFAIIFLVGLFVMLWSILLIIPGIIAALGYSMVYYLMADGSIDIMGTLKKSQEMMNGYKWDYFVFNLSFLGWLLLGVITLGIAYIYVVPYMSVANTLYYEELKSKKESK